MTFNEFRELIVGKRVIGIVEDKEVFLDDVIAIDAIILEDGTRIHLGGQADVAFVSWIDWVSTVSSGELGVDNGQQNV